MITKEPKLFTNGILLVNDEQLEKSVIGFLISNPDAYVRYSPRLSIDSFYNDKSKKIYRDIIEANNRGYRPDSVYLSSIYNNDRDSIYISEIADSIFACTELSSVESGIQLLEEFRKRRVAQTLGMRLLGAGTMESEDITSEINKALNKFESNSVGTIKDKNEVIAELIKMAEDNFNYAGDLNLATYTGFSIIDKQGGFVPESLIVISAGTSSGKTSFALSILKNAMIQGQSIGVYSMEMTAASIGSRLMNILGLGIRSARLRTQKMSEGEIYRLYNIAREMKNLPGNFYVDDSSKTSIQKIIASIRRLKREKNIQGVIVDYIQILNVWGSGNKKSGTDEQQLADAARLLQAEAKSSHIWIIILSQLSRLPKTALTHLPTQDMIRGSGQIAEACDISITLYRPYMFNESYPDDYEDVETDGTAMMTIHKWRDAEANVSQIIGFNPEKTEFYELDQVPKKGEFVDYKRVSSQTNQPF